MKLSKKILAAFSVAAMLVTAASFVGCKDEDDEDDAFSGGKVNFDNRYVTVTTAKDGTVTVKNAKESTNGAISNSEYFYRAFNKTSTKHRGGIVEITLTPDETIGAYSGVDDPASGHVGGFVFDLVDGSVEGTYSFCVASVRWNKSGKLQTYISKYTDVKVSNNNFTKKSNFVLSDDTEVSNNKGENQILPVYDGSTYYTDLDGFSLENGSVTVVIAVIKAEDGGYWVGYYDDVAKAKSDGETTDEPLANAKVKQKVDTKYTSSSDGKTQAKLAYYANIYPNNTMVANFKFTKTYGADAVFESNPNVISE